MREIDILGILPQRPPFLFVDFLLSFNEEVTETEYVVKEDSPLVEDGKFLPAGLLENMAQSCAARTGYISKYILKIPVSIGYIGEVKNFNVKRQPLVGETLRTVVNFKMEFAGISLCSVEVMADSEVIASAVLKNAVAQN